MSIDVLFAHCLFLSRDPVERRLMTPYFPLGILYLAAVLREAGYRVAIFDGTFRSDPTEIRQAIETHQPRVIALSVLNTIRGTALELAEHAHEMGVPVIVGGADPTARPEAYLTYQANGQYPIDVVVIGEGEETLLELMPTLLRQPGARPLEGIRGLAFRDPEGNLIRTPPRPLRRDIDSLPFPARDLVDLDSYQRAWRAHHGYSSLSVIASRGCPFSCAWCQKSVFGQSCRLRDPRLVAEEMRLIKDRYAPDQVRIVDDVLGINRNWVKAWHDHLLALDAIIPFECLSRVDLVDREMLIWLKEAGCVRISFGAESGSQKVLDAMNKGTTVEQIRKAADLCHELGIEVYFYIMLGYPGETWEDIQATIRLLRETRPDQFSSTIAYPLPGTPFYEQVRDHLVELPDWSHTAENRLLYRGRYRTQFYRWAQRLLHKEWLVARVKAGNLSLDGKSKFKAMASLQALRWGTSVLRHLPADSRVLTNTY